MRKYAKKNLKFFPSLTFTKDFVWSTFYSKTRVFPTFLKRGSLEFAHIRSTCGPDLPRARHALRFDAYFRQGLPWKKVRCVMVQYNKGLSGEEKLKFKPNTETHYSGMFGISNR